MQKCAFCAGENIEINAGGLRLCARCRDQLCALNPEEKRYDWYVRAVSRARNAGKGAALSLRRGAR